MTLHKLSAGTGYEYLTRQVAALDSTEKGATPLADYYAAKGESPGRWTGSGLVGIDGVAADDTVTAEQMRHLFGTGSHPLTAQSLGRPYKVYGTEGVDGFNAEVKRRVEKVSTTSTAEETSSTIGGGRAPTDVVARIRSEVAKEWFEREKGRAPNSARELSGAVARYSRPRQTAVAGYDLTFSPVKSVSALWALAPPEVAKAVEQAHDAAVADALAYIERDVLFTREGANGVRQVGTRGLIGTAFTHRDSRAGDPDLHTHVAVANKVQTREGKWLSIYGTVLHEHVVAASEVYNTALEYRLQEGLGVRFQDVRCSGETRPVREILGIDPVLIAHWSRRSQLILVRTSELTREFTESHGRPPAATEKVALAQQANLETRQAKHEPRSESEQRGAWRRDVGMLGLDGDQVVHAALNPPLRETALPAASMQLVRSLADRVIRELESHRATWQTWHVYAEVQRQIRGLDIPSAYLAQVAQLVVDAAEQDFINLTPEVDELTDPTVLRRADGTSVYRHSGSDHFTSQRILEAEARLTDAAGIVCDPFFDRDDVEVSILASEAEATRLNRGQRALVRDLATSPHPLRLALAPAGAGKTTAMNVLAQVWTDIGYDAIGLAPSAAAASVLTQQTGMFAETLAKLDHLISVGDTDSFAGSIGPTTLIVIDEAGMADTLTLDRVVSYCLDRGATVRLIGDDQQLAAVGAGGVLRDIATTHGAVRLDEVVRFADPVEAEATLDLRDGDASALGFYLDHDRVHVGDVAASVAEVFGAWSRERAGGRDCLMLAPTYDLVRELNARARQARLDGTLPTEEVELRDGIHASVGDTIITRRNERRLGVSGTDWVKNGDRWTILDIGEKSISVRHMTSKLSATLPRAYVFEHADLGYATTVHTAQGLTADAMHGIVTGTETRQLCYTMLTRGRAENHLHVVLSPEDDGHMVALSRIEAQATATEILEGILARDGAAVSATTTHRHAQSPATRLCEATGRYDDAVVRGAQRVIGSGWDDALDAAGAGPLPWLQGVPPEVGRSEEWSRYLGARAGRVSAIAAEVRSTCLLPRWTHRYADLLAGELYDEVLVWRAANGVAEDDRRLLGAVPDNDTAAYHHRLQRRINDRHTAAVRSWEAKVVGYVGHSDNATLDLARLLDSVQRDGRDAERLLDRAAVRKPLPDDHPTAALAYRLRQQLKPKPQVEDPLPEWTPTQQGPALGL